MKPLFKNITKYNKENYNNLLEFHKDKFGVKIILTTLIMLILYIYILALNIIYRNWIVVLIIIIFTGILYAINKVLRNQKKQERVHKRRIQRNKNYVYDFYRYYMKVRIGREGQTIYYLKLYKVYETEDYFYLYLNKDYSLIVSKDGFTIGNSRRFSKFIKKRCILKYKDETI